MNYRILSLQEIVDSLIIVISKSIHLAVLLDRKSALFSFGPLQQVTYNRLPTIRVFVTCMNSHVFSSFLTRILKQTMRTRCFCPTKVFFFPVIVKTPAIFSPSQTGEKQEDVLGGSHKVS
jgi:hypothetical protein